MLAGCGALQQQQLILLYASGPVRRRLGNLSGELFASRFRFYYYYFSCLSVSGRFSDESGSSHVWPIWALETAKSSSLGDSFAAMCAHI